MKNFEEYTYAGIPTFMGSDYISISESGDYDAVFIGVPIDYGASYRLGAKYSPRMIREYSFWDRVDGLEYYDFDTRSLLQSNNLKIADLGDINIYPTDPIRNSQEIVSTVSKVRRGALPIVMGGDHSVLYSSFVGCTKGVDKDNLFLIYFDAHLDVERQYITLPDLWHGNVIRKLVEDGFINPENIFCIGARGIVDKEWLDYVKDKKINVFSSRDVKELGINTVMKEIFNKIKDTDGSVYVSFDIDSIDASQVSGTGTPKYNGLSMVDAVTAVRSLNQVRVIGFDMVEINPKFDQAGQTSISGCEILFNFLAFGFKKYENSPSL